MSATSRLLYDLENLAGSAPAHRATVLRRIEALFIASDIDGDDERTRLFDDVLCRLAASVDTTERAAFASRIAGLRHRPANVTDMLVRDADPEVAVPILSGAKDIGEPTLVACAREGGHLHLLALARRDEVTEPVSDILVERGDDVVLIALTENMGARFSSDGFVTLVRRADGNAELVNLIARRSDVSSLVDLVRRNAEEGATELPAEVKALLRVADCYDRSRLDYSAAIPAVQRLMRVGRLGEDTLRQFALDGTLPHVVATIAAMAGRSSAEVESALFKDDRTMLDRILGPMRVSPETREAVLALHGR